MKFFTKKLTQNLVFLLLTLSSNGFADEIVEDIYPLDNCCDDECPRWSVHADALIWKVSNPGVSIGNINVLVPSIFAPPAATSITSGVIDLDFKWDVGYAIGAEYRLPCNSLFAIDWLNFNGRAKKEIFEPTVPGRTTQFFSPWGGEIIDDPITASGNWKMNLNVVDLSLKQSLVCTPCFSLDPIIGVRILTIDQRFHHAYSGFVFPTTTLFRSTNINLKNDFSGAGLLAGFASQYDICYGFSVYAKGAISLVYGRFDVNTSGVSVITGPSAPPTSTFTQSDHFNECATVTDLALGIQWRYLVTPCMGLTVKFGWEQFVLYDFSRFDSVNTPIRSDRALHQDICLDGFTISAALDF